MLQAKKTETKTTAVSEATKDAGRVQMGGGAIHF